MNKLEEKMISILKDLKENYFALGIKAEFEAEGTRIEEAMRLKEVITKAGLELTIKIGGCEAMKDLFDARTIGASRIVAPMIESPFALKKFVQSFEKAYPAEEREYVEFLINIETITSYEKFDEMLSSNEINKIDGIVLGRVDMVGSLNLTRNDINSDKVFNLTKELFIKAKTKKLQCGLGGGVSEATLPFLEKLPKDTVDYFETRKLIFKYPECSGNKAALALTKAVEFELMWLKNKRDFYGFIYKEDATRIEMLQSRYDKLASEAAFSKTN